MKILHVSSIAGVAKVIRDEQRARGHDSTLVDFHTPALGFEIDEEVSFARRLQLPFTRFDVVHLHSCSLWPFYLDGKIDLVRRLGKKVVYHHHGNDIRSKGCPVSNINVVHLASNKDTLKWCDKSVYVPLPVACDEWRRANDEIKVLQKQPACENKRYLENLGLLKGQMAVDLPRFLLGTTSTTGVQAEARGVKVVDSVPFPHEVGFVCDLLDWLYKGCV